MAESSISIGDREITQEEFLLAAGISGLAGLTYTGLREGYRYTQVPDALSVSDPREQMANQLLRRGHASMDEVLKSSYGEWPPKGLDIIADHPQQLRFGNIIDRAGDLPSNGFFSGIRNKVNVLNNVYGDASIVGDRLIRMNEVRLSTIPSLVGKSALSSTLGHEGVHILQGDNAARAGQIYGDEAMSVARSQMVSGINDASLKVFKDHTNTSFVDNLSASDQRHFHYVKEGIETQARVHQITMEGYQHWGQLPANREELLVAMKDSGMDIPDTIMRELDNSPTIAQTREIFSTGNTAVHHAANDLNFIQEGLTQEGKIAFWDNAMPELYSDMIEMYGDGPGRARFGLGENIRANLAAGNEIAAGSANSIVSESQWNLIQKGDMNGIEVNVESMSPYQRAKVMLELEDAGIEGKIVSSSVENNEKVIRVMGDENVSRIQQAAQTGHIPHVIPDQMIAGQKWQNVTDHLGNTARYVDLQDIEPDELDTIKKGLQERGVNFEIKQSSLNVGTEVLAVSGKDTLHIENLKITASQGGKAMSLTDDFAKAANGGLSEMARFARLGANTPAIGMGVGVGAAALTNRALAGQKDLAEQMKDEGVLSQGAYEEYIALNQKTEALLHGDIGLSTADPTGLSVIVTAGVEMKAHRDFKNWADEHAPHLTSQQFDSLSMSLVTGESARTEMLNEAVSRLPFSTQGQPEILHDVIEARALRDQLSAAPFENGGFDPGLFDEDAFVAAQNDLRQEMENLMSDPQGIDTILNSVPVDERMDYVTRLAKSEPDQEALADNHPEIAAYVEASENSLTGWFMDEDDVLKENPDLLNAYIKERSGIDPESGPALDNTHNQDIQLASFNGQDASFDGDPEILNEASAAGIDFHWHFMDDPQIRREMEQGAPQNTSPALGA